MIGKKLKHLISLRGCKQVDLAHFLGISPSRLSNYLSDKREPSLEMLAEMADFFKVDLNYFSERSFSIEQEGINQYMLSENRIEKSTIVDVPLIQINAKKRGLNTFTIPFSKLFLRGISEPEKNAVVFEVNSNIPIEIAKEDDYVVCAKSSSVELNDGDFLFENGRNVKFYRYYNHNGNAVLINEYNKKEHIVIEDEADLDNYFKVFWIISKYD